MQTILRAWSTASLGDRVIFSVLALCALAGFALALATGRTDPLIMALIASGHVAEDIVRAIRSERARR